MKNNLLLIVSLLFIFSCQTNIIPHDEGLYFNSNKSMPRFTLSNFRSVQNRKHQDSSLALVTAISGGGTRAANFGVGVLLGLEQLKSGNTNMLNEVDYFSTVSGGGFAAGVYMNSLYSYNLYRRKIEKDTSAKVTPYSLDSFYIVQLKSILLKDYQFSLYAAFIRGIFNAKINSDVALEHKIDDEVLGYKYRKGKDKKSIRLGNIFKWVSDTGHVIYPYFITNATCIDNNAIVQYTPDVIAALSISQFTHRYSTNGKSNVPLKRSEVMVMPLSLGIKTSGSFPILIKNTTLVSAADSINLYKYKYLRLIDGGVADNFGTTTAIEILDQEKLKKKGLIVIDAANGVTPGIFATTDKVKMEYALSKQMTSGLDAKYFNFIEDLNQTCTAKNIKPVILSIRNLDDPALTLPGVLINKDIAIADLLKKYKTYPDIEKMNATDRKIIFLIASNVSTKYNITKGEQDLLILAGKTVVWDKRNELLDLMK